VEQNDRLAIQTASDIVTKSRVQKDTVAIAAIQFHQYDWPHLG